MKYMLIAVVMVMGLGCNPLRPHSYSYTSENLKIQQISDAAFVHVSYLNTDDFGKVACNGLVFIDGDEAIVFDTPTDEIASVELIRWIENKKNKRVKAVVATHFHADCIGGLQTFHSRAIDSYAHNPTIARAQENAAVVPLHGFDEQLNLIIGKQTVQILFSGQGHTADNVVGYIPAEKILFGGCLIKSQGAGKGYLGDANAEEWPITVRKLKEKMPDIKTVVPGHGAYGGVELLDYTIRLFEKKIEE